MQCVEAVGDANVFDAGGQPAYTLRGGKQYVLYDSEVAAGLRDGALTHVSSLDRILPSYRREPLENHRLVLPFIGRLGDAIAAASCVAALCEKYPTATVDIASMPATREVFELLPRFGELYAYPVEADQLGRYAFYLSFEEVEAVHDGTHRSFASVFSACLQTPRPARPAAAAVPNNVRTRWALPACDRPRVAVHVGANDNLRSYPHDLTRELIALLAREGFEVFLIGAPDRSCMNFAKPDVGEHDLLWQTPKPADLAAVLQQMNVVITGDSFPLHLAGALGISTIATFTSTDAVIGSDYPSVKAMQSTASCSPCRIAHGKCPAGHADCIAHRHPSLSPATIVATAQSLLCEQPVH